MYFGSVKFYKHLILAIALLVFFAPTIGCVALGMQNHQLKTEIKDLTGQLSANGLPVNTSADDSESLDLSLNDKSYAAGTDNGGVDAAAKYPELYVDRPKEYRTEDSKTVYLTFDDGPSKLTPQILDLLKENDVKATFFILYHDDSVSRELYNRMIAEGHTIGIHGTTHKYKQIYQSVDAFLDDFAAAAYLVQNTTGYKPEIFRFPGGSVNGYNKDVRQDIISEMSRRGYEYYDWNVSSGDAASEAISADHIAANVIEGVSGKKRAVVLMHDSAMKEETVKALPQIISSLREAGYRFEALSNHVEPTIF